MLTLARLRLGRVLLHLLAMLGGQCVRFHVAGIIRQLPWVAAAQTLLTRTRIRLISASAGDLAHSDFDSIPVEFLEPMPLNNGAPRVNCSLREQRRQGAPVAPWRAQAIRSQ